MEEVEMKNVNKTILLASTLFISQAIMSGTYSYAEEDYKLDVDDSLSQDIGEDEASTSEDNKIATYDDDNLDKILSDLEEMGYVNTSNEESEAVNTEENNTEDKASEASEKELAPEQEISVKEISGDKGPADDKEVKEDTSKDIIYYDNSSLDDIYNEVKVRESNTSTSDKGVSTQNKSTSKSDWYEENSKVYHKDSEGNVSKGLTEIEGKKYYFGEDGSLQTNKKILTNDSYYEASDRGILSPKANSWVNVNGKTYRTNENGKIYKGVTKVGNDYYNFNDEGALTTNKKEIKDGKLYITNKDGKITNPKNSWAAIDGKTYRSGNDGKLVKGAHTIAKYTYVFDRDGVMAQNKGIMSAGRFYKTDSRGVATNPKNAWFEFNGNKYHTNANGYVQEGVWEIDGNYYYFTSNGLQKNTEVTQKGITYKVDGNGLAKPVDNNIKGSKNLDKAMEWMFTARRAGLTYDMHWKNRTSDWAADCSSAVYRSLIYGGFLKQGSAIGNTETLFQLGAAGKVMYEISESEIRYGDIFVSGRPGASAGAAGHTGFILNRADDTIIHMSYGQNGVAVTPRKGYMGDSSGLPVRYYRLVGADSDRLYENKK